MADPQLLRFLDREAEVAETQASRIRVVVLVLVELRLVLAQGHEMLAGVPKHWVSTASIALGLIASAGLIRAVKRYRNKERVLVASVLLDSLLAFVIVGAGVAQPRDAYVGVLAAPDFAIWPIIATSAGLRLSPAAARAGSWSALAGIGGLVVADQLLNLGRIAYGPPEIGLGLVLMVAAMLLAGGIERRGRRLVLEGAERAVRAERTRSRFGAYVPEPLVDALIEGDLAAPGVEQDVAVLFADLRGFTSYSEKVDPATLVRELNGYLEVMVGVVRDHGGIVDKYLGDGVLVVFGVPTHTGDDATRAIRAALAMDAALTAHSAARVRTGRPALGHGIGVHRGSVVAGNIGTAERLQFTVLGDVVNVASRLQEACKERGVSVLLSDALVHQAEAEGQAALTTLQALEPLTPRGRRTEVGVYTTRPHGAKPIG